MLERFDTYGVSSSSNTLTATNQLRALMAAASSSRGATSKMVGPRGPLPVGERAVVFALLGVLAPICRAALSRAVVEFEATRAGVSTDVSTSDALDFYLAGSDPVEASTPWIRITPVTLESFANPLASLSGLFGIDQPANVTLPRGGITLAPVPLGGSGTEAFATEIRALMRAWQEVLDTASLMLALGLFVPAARRDELVVPLWRAAYRVALSADTIGDVTQTASGTDRIMGALEAAKGASATAAGELLAGAANLVGETAGQVGAGFLDGLGLYGAAAVAAWYLLR